MSPPDSLVDEPGRSPVSARCTADLPPEKLMPAAHHICRMGSCRSLLAASYLAMPRSPTEVVSQIVVRESGMPLASTNVTPSSKSLG